MVVAKDKIRNEIFKAVYNLLNADKPKYSVTRDSTTTVHTSTILSAFPEDDTVYPCIVINPPDKSTRIVTIDGSQGEYKVEISIEFYTKTSHGKASVDTMQEYAEFNLVNNCISDITSVNTGTGGQEVNFTV